jgi:hypothetical protein
LTGCAFLLVPTDRPTRHEDWDGLDRAARMERLRSELAELGAKIRSRLPDVDLEYLEGAGAWTARSQSAKRREELVEKLSGLPVEVATDDRFYAL